VYQVLAHEAGAAEYAYHLVFHVWILLGCNLSGGVRIG
jgi:hypothetical protein